MASPRPASVSEATTALRQAYRDVWRMIVARQSELLADPRRAATAARLALLQAEVERELTALDRNAARWIRTNLAQVYATGGTVAAADIGGAPFVWNAAHREAFRIHAQDLYDDLLSATRYVRRDTKRFIREAARLRSLYVTTGETAKAGGRQLARELADHGIAAVRYSNGARHGLQEYAEMAIRTKTAVAYNEGAIQQGEQDGINWYECFDGPGCGWTTHGSPDQALGKIVTADEARANPISHPNCRRSFGPRPDVTSKKEARTAVRSVTDEQIAAQVAADEAQRRARRVR